MTKKLQQPEDPVLKELESIKNLLILLLYALDVPSEEINKAVKKGASNIRGMFSKKDIKKSKFFREVIYGKKDRKDK